MLYKLPPSTLVLGVPVSSVPIQSFLTSGSNNIFYPSSTMIPGFGGSSKLQYGSGICGQALDRFLLPGI